MTKFLYRPLKSQFILSQNFGENNVCIWNDSGKIFPRTTPTCPVGSMSLYAKVGLKKGHNGLDFPAKDWESLYASLEGIVTELSTEPSRGLGIGIVSEQEYKWSDAFSATSGTNQIKHRYWHLAGMNVKMGDKVKVGDLIGWCDNTGYSTGSHLHYETKPVKDGKNVLQGNSMFGAIDPLPLMNLNLTAFEKNDLLAKIKLQLMDLFQQVADLLAKR